MILAAGYAQRLGAYTVDTPKALLTIGGQTMLDRLVDKLDELKGIEEIVVVSNHRFYEQFIAWHEARGNRKDIRILNDNTTSNENRLGAIGDMRFALDTLKVVDDWFVLASDNLFDFSLQGVYDFYRRTGAPTVVGIELNDRAKLRQFAVAELSADGRIIAMEEKPENPRGNIGVFALYIYPRGVMARVHEYLATGGKADAPGNFPVWLYRLQSVYCYLAPSMIYDVGTVAELERLRAEYEVNAVKKDDGDTSLRPATA